MKIRQKLLMPLLWLMLASACTAPAKDENSSAQNASNGEKGELQEKVEVNTENPRTSGGKSNAEMEAYTGIYINPENQGGNSMATVVMNHAENGNFSFEIATANQKGCTGRLSGVVKMGDDLQGSFSSEDCQELTFQFVTQGLKLEEENCEAHGMECGFAGIYEKKR